MSIHHRPYCPFIALRFASLRMATLSLWAGLEGATPFRSVNQQDLGTDKRHTISRRCPSVSAATQTLVWLDRQVSLTTDEPKRQKR
jgi:hypothetical protein